MFYSNHVGLQLSCCWSRRSSC